MKAECTASTGDNAVTLQVSDGSETATADLIVTVTQNTAPMIGYGNVTVGFNDSATNLPSLAEDNGAIVDYALQDTGSYGGNISVDFTGLVTISGAAPSGTHTITIRATDDCGASSDTSFTLTVNEAPSFAIDDVTLSEGDSGTTAYTFTVTKSGSTALSSSVHFATTDGTATVAGADYAAASGTLTFGPTETTKQITVEVNGDTTFEPDETFTVNLTDAVNATISRATGTGTIVNDDAAPTFSINSVSHNEGDSGQTEYVFTVTKNGVSEGSSSVEYATVDGSALAENDYVATSGTLHFSASETTQQIVVLVNGDKTVEGDETFTVQLSNVVNDRGARLDVVLPDGIGTIVNDDHAPVAKAVTSSTEENNAKTITLAASDVDGDALTFTVIVDPTNGTLGCGLAG